MLNSFSFLFLFRHYSFLYATSPFLILFPLFWFVSICFACVVCIVLSCVVLFRFALCCVALVFSFCCFCFGFAFVCAVLVCFVLIWFWFCFALIWCGLAWFGFSLFCFVSFCSVSYVCFCFVLFWFDFAWMGWRRLFLCLFICLFVSLSRRLVDKWPSPSRPVVTTKLLRPGSCGRNHRWTSCSKV